MPHQTLIITFRLFHILSGLFWVGSVILLARFLFPALRATGPAGGAVMRHLTGPGKLPVAMNAAAGLTILSGIGLMWAMQNLSNGTWIHSPTGMTFALGGLLGLTAAIVGGAVSRPTAKKLGELGAQIAATQGPPSAEQAALMQRLQQRMGTATNVLSVILGLAVVCMAIARYV